MQSEADRVSRDRLKKLEAILSGDTTIALHLQFLIRTNKADLQILKNTKVLGTAFSHWCESVARLLSNVDWLVAFVA